MESGIIDSECASAKALQSEGRKGRMKDRLKQEQGFTLIEVLAAIIILSIVSLVLTSYFTNAMSYAKANQNKTIMVNLARNALFYAEKQDFDEWKAYFTKVENNNTLECSATGTSCTTYNNMVDDTKVLEAVLNPFINKIQYHIQIVYQRDTHNRMSASKTDFDKDISPYLIPVEVVVWNSKDTARTKQTVVEGYITDEKIR